MTEYCWRLEAMRDRSTDIMSMLITKLRIVIFVYGYNSHFMIKYVWVFVYVFFFQHFYVEISYYCNLYTNLYYFSEYLDNSATSGYN